MAATPEDPATPQAVPSPAEPDATDAAAYDEATQRLARAVGAAETALIEFEIAVETFRIEVENFSRLHEERLGPLYARLEELDAAIAEAVAARTGDPEDERRARELRAAIMPMPGVAELFHGWLDGDGFSPEGYAMLTQQSVQRPPRVRPSDEARRLYRELVRRCHPDLATDANERDRRDAFVARVNQAYARGDEAALRELADEWERGPAPEPGRMPADELYARLEWLAARKDLLADAVAALEDSAVGSMLRMAGGDPDGMLDEIAEGLRRRVAEREAELAGLLADDPGTADGTGPAEPGGGDGPAR
ncbi:J domain-containing protein [Streptomyces sp. RFCAC02]|uniref:J domain-containing protein n=1 Tax=Streptomyces sp. RFCAC02 TaxID=2499143 RepID=UPI001F0ED6B9|nr:J domain-containing protein [Streptomyces sp. RFCAC02]